MSLVLVRVDDRLIHGQVVVGWGQAVAPDRIVLVDDDVAANAWERDLYRAGVPPDLESEFATIEEAASRVMTWTASDERVLLLVANIDSLIRLCEGAPAIREVNLGGLHRAGEAKQRLAYLFLSDEELAALRRLRENGVSITAQDLPTTAPVPLEEIE